jgi:hypothetical protein
LRTNKKEEERNEEEKKREEPLLIATARFATACYFAFLAPAPYSW